MTRALLCGFFAVGVLSGTPAQGTSAFFSTAVTSTANQFTAGTLHIGESLAANTTLSMDNLLAGDNFDAQLDIANSGTLSLLYSMTSTIRGSASLASALQLTVRAKTTNPCSSRDGTSLYSGALSSAAIGDPTHGAQPGDRTLPGGSTDSLCFTVLLPSTASSSLAAQSVSATFTLFAEQS
jgi:camelysin-like metallo-endopeptidase